MEDIARLAVDHSLKFGAKYAEAKVQRNLGNTYALKNGTAEPLTVTRKLGVGIRVITGGALGFASTNNLNPESVRSAAESAVRTANASKKLLGSPLRLSHEKAWTDRWEANVKTDFQEISPDKKFEG